MHCTTSRKVAGFNPDGVIGIFHWHNPSSRTVALGLTQPPTQMSTRNTSLGGEGGRCVGLTTLPPSCADCLEIWEPQPPGTLRASPGLQWDCFFACNFAVIVHHEKYVLLQNFTQLKAVSIKYYVICLYICLNCWVFKSHFFLCSMLC